MNQVMKKIGAMVLALSLTIGSLSACGSKGENEKPATTASLRYEVDVNTPAWKLDAETPATLSWYINAEWWNSEWGNDFITKQIEKDMNIKIEFLKGDNTKLNTMFAGDDMPDMLTVFQGADSRSVIMSANQWAYSLNELADTYDPYFYQVASKDTLNWLKLSDGKTYGYSNYSNTKEDYETGKIRASTAFTIRKDVNAALGQPAMGSPEEFLSTLGQIKEKYPELTPFGFNDMKSGVGSLGGDFQNFIGVPIEDEDGNFYNRNLDEDYLNWIRTFNQAYLNGYISDDSFSDDSTAYEDKIKSGQYATIMMGGTPQRSTALQVFLTANPDGQYIAIDGPQSTVGRAPTLSQSGISGWMLNYITKQCKDPAKAIQLFTYLLSDEGQILQKFGREGETYTVNSDGLFERTEEIKKLKEENIEQFKKEYRFDEFMMFGHDRYIQLGADNNPAIEQMQKWGEGKLKPQFLIEDIDPDQGTPEARSLTAIDTKWNTTLVSLIRAKGDNEFNSILEDYKNFLKDNGWDAIVKIRSENMQKNREKLGIE